MAWVDANGPCLGEEEIRRMPDPTFTLLEPVPVRPRLKTAPKINRFKIRQDEDVVENILRHLNLSRDLVKFIYMQHGIRYRFFWQGVYRG